MIFSRSIRFHWSMAPQSSLQSLERGEPANGLNKYNGCSRPAVAPLCPPGCRLMLDWAVMGCVQENGLNFCMRFLLTIYLPDSTRLKLLLNFRSINHNPDSLLHTKNRVQSLFDGGISPDFSKWERLRRPQKKVPVSARNRRITYSVSI